MPWYGSFPKLHHCLELICHTIRNVAVKRRRVEAFPELLNKEAVDVQK